MSHAICYPTKLHYHIVKLKYDSTNFRSKFWYLPNFTQLSLSDPNTYVTIIKYFKHQLGAFDSLPFAESGFPIYTKIQAKSKIQVQLEFLQPPTPNQNVNYCTPPGSIFIHPKSNNVYLKNIFIKM